MAKSSKSKVTKPKSGSTVEEEAVLLFRTLKVPPPQREYLFIPGRRFRFDFAWPDKMLALEVEGGVHIGGRHLRPAGYTSDCFKYTEAALRGWTVMRATPSQVRDGTLADWLSRAF